MAEKSSTAQSSGLREQKECAPDLWKNHIQFRSFTQEIRDYAIFIVDTKGTVINWNVGAERIKGYRADEIIGRNMECFYTREDQERGIPLQLLQKAAAEGRVENEGWRVRKDRSRFWADVVITAVHGEDGNLVGFTKITRDMTERKRMEEKLRDGEARLRLAHQAAKIGAFEWDVQTGVNVWTPELEDMYGLGRGEFARTESAWEQLVHPEDRAAAIDKVNEAFATGEPVECEWRVVWPDGTVHWITGRFQLFKDANGNPARLSGANIDITERKRIEDELRRSLDELQHFAFIASHDLAEPLRKIQTFSNMVIDKYAQGLDKTGTEYLKRVQDAAGRDARIIASTVRVFPRNLESRTLYGVQPHRRRQGCCERSAHSNPESKWDSRNFRTAGDPSRYRADSTAFSKPDRQRA